MLWANSAIDGIAAWKVSKTQFREVEPDVRVSPPPSRNTNLYLPEPFSFAVPDMYGEKRRTRQSKDRRHVKRRAKTAYLLLYRKYIRAKGKIPHDQHNLIPRASLLKSALSGGGCHGDGKLRAQQQAGFGCNPRTNETKDSLTRTQAPHAKKIH